MSDPIMDAPEPAIAVLPDDARQPVPESLPDPATAFGATTGDEPKERETGQLLTEDELRESREELDGILRAQRFAETLTGVGRR